MAVEFQPGDRKLRPFGGNRTCGTGGVTHVRRLNLVFLPEANNLRSQTSPNNLCQFSYAFHTEDDKDLWAAQHVRIFHIGALNLS